MSEHAHDHHDAGGEVVELPARYPMTDLGNADRFVDRHKDDVRYCDPWSKWLVWDEHRWRLDDTVTVQDYAKKTVRAIADDLHRLPTQTLRDAMVKHMRKSEQSPRVRAITDLARSHHGIPIRPGELDANRWVLNVRNGTLDLKTLKLQPHQRTDLITKLAPVDYDPDAAAPRWERFLDEIFAGDQELVHFVQRAAGYSLTGDTSAQVFFLLHGTGENGKSTFLEALRALLGDYAQQAPADTFLERKYQGIPNDVARLQGARFVTATETGENRRLDETLVKRMTGGDRITARFLRAEFFEFEPLFKVWLATNHKPVVKGTDHAIWRRIRLIPFNVTIPADQRDNDLPAKLHAELPGILNWAIAGLRDYTYGDGLEPPAAVTKATDEYRTEEDTLGRFIEERCTLDDTARVKASDLYKAYSQWCQDNGERYDKQTAFGRSLAERGFDDFKSGGLIWRRGLDLQNAQETLETGDEPDWARDEATNA